MKHELTHIRQKHSYDIVFIELLNILFWLSPMVYLYKKSLKNVHEYLADAAVLKEVSPPSVWQAFNSAITASHGDCLCQ